MENKTGTNFFTKINEFVWVALTNDEGFGVMGQCIGDPNVVALDVDIYAPGFIMYRKDATPPNNILINIGTMAVPVWSAVGTAIVTPLQFSCSDLATDLITGVNKGYQDCLVPGTVVSVYAAVLDPQLAGLVLTFDILKNGFSILDTLITIDNGELNSLSAAIPAVIKANTTCVRGDRFTVDIIQVGTPAAKGLQVGVNLA